MSTAMATQDQLDVIQKMVDEKVDPNEISHYFARMADLNERGRLRVLAIATDLYVGKIIEADDEDDLSRFSND